MSILRWTLEYVHHAVFPKNTYRINQHSFETEEAAIEFESKFKEAYKIPFKSIEDLQAHIKMQLQGRISRLEEELKTLKHDLSVLETRYVAETPLSQFLDGKHAMLIQLFAGLKAKAGSATVGSLRVTNDYMNAGPGLFVFTLPEYDVNNVMFDQASCDRILRVMAQVGLTHVDSWNGPGFHTWSVKVKV